MKNLIYFNTNNIFSPDYHLFGIVCTEEIISLLKIYYKLDSELLFELVKMKMPYGKYKGTLICNLPEFYLSWYHSKGFPAGRLGMLLSTMYEIKLNGLEYLLGPLKK
ncbi:MAG: DUF3820 family protein [Daejeonella sp.]